MLLVLLACGTPEAASEAEPPVADEGWTLDPHADVQGTWTLDDPRLEASWTFAFPKVSLTLPAGTTEGTYTVGLAEHDTVTLVLDDGPLQATVRGDTLTL
ncbi:MAG: hypothetical protein GY884_31355, partial [Proteobacteria bacterium]|nr:hypothetical protein [Pseudomonadota bacterium]